MAVTEILPAEDPNPTYGLFEIESVDGVRYERYHQPDREGATFLVGATPEAGDEPTSWFLATSKRAARAFRV